MCKRLCASYPSPSQPTVGSGLRGAVLPEGKRDVAGWVATHRLQTDPTLQQHGKGGSQMGHRLGPGAQIHDRALASLGLSFPICEVGQNGPCICEVLGPMSALRLFHMGSSFSEG